MGDWRKSLPEMTDPTTALDGFQLALLSGIELKRGVLHKDLYVYVDHPQGETRFTFVTLEGKTVSSFVEFVSGQPIKGTQNFSIGYAVPEAYRKQGRGKKAVEAAIAEMRHVLGQYVMPFYIEAIVGEENTASRRIAEQLISDSPVKMKDGISGLPAFRYVRKIEQATP